LTFKKIIENIDMEALLIEGSQKTPTVHFEPGKGVLEIKGRSIPDPVQVLRIQKCPVSVNTQ